jgi:metallo-beta-lactamase class B
MVLLLLLASVAALGQKLDITRLTGDFYIYTTYNDFGGKPFPSNGMYVVTSEGVALFDTPWDKTQFQPLLDSIEKRHHQKVVMCVATHYHDDRTAGLGYYKTKGIPTWSSRQTLRLCRKHGENQGAASFKKDTVFTLGQYRFRTLYPGAGHTKDNIVIWFEKEKILYGGCLVKSTDNQSLGNIADADLKAWPKSIKKIMQLCPNPAYVIPGHFSWVDNKALEHTLRLLGSD